MSEAKAAVEGPTDAGRRFSDWIVRNLATQGARRHANRRLQSHDDRQLLHALVRSLAARAHSHAICDAQLWPVCVPPRSINSERTRCSHTNNGRRAIAGTRLLATTSKGAGDDEQQGPNQSRDGSGGW